MAEITLSTGKKVAQREKKGQHHFIERSLLANCMKEGGQNLGGIMSTVTIQTVVGIQSVDGMPVKIPEKLAEVFELMDNFTYEEWAELETKSLPKEAQAKLEEAAKNLQTSPGSETASN
jgi:hypothetical protein